MSACHTSEGTGEDEAAERKTVGLRQRSALVDRYEQVSLTPAIPRNVSLTPFELRSATQVPFGFTVTVNFSEVLLTNGLIAALS